MGQAHNQYCNSSRRGSDIGFFDDGQHADLFFSEPTAAITSRMAFPRRMVNTLRPYGSGVLSRFGVQLFFNFFWSIIFFNLEAYLFAFIWLLILWVLIIIYTVLFYRISKPAGILMIPYILWVTFAAYLNFAIFLLN